MTAVLLGVAAGLAALAWATAGLPSPSSEAARPALPGRVAWAWERPEDLRFLDPERDAVAVLVQTVRIDGAGIAVLGRRQPLVLPAGIAEVAVTRIEVEAGTELGGAAVEEAAEAIAATAGDGAHEIQVDFDARRSERPFYAALLSALRRRLPRTPISITALASWCLGDRWLDRAWGGTPPIDDAVPMLFRMAADDRRVRAHLAAGGDFASPLCRQSVGLATDEPWPALPSGWARTRRLYLFHPRPWNAVAWASASNRGRSPTEPR